MKYDFLIKQKSKNSSDEINPKIDKNEDNSIVASTMLSTYDDFNIFLKKNQDKIINENNDIDKKQIIDDNPNNQNTENKSSKKKDNSTLFESEKKTVETIVKYSSSFLSIILNFIYMLKNTITLLISKKKLNTDSIKDKEIIDKFNKHNGKHNKHIKKNDKHIEKKNDKHKAKHEKYSNKHIKNMNSYLLDLE